MSTTPLPRSLSADFPPASNDVEVSLLYSMLPSAVQSRLPRLPSFRRSISMYPDGKRRKSTDSRPSTGTSSGSSTPGGYTSAMVMSDLKGFDDDDRLLYHIEGSSEVDSGSNTPEDRRGVRLELMDVQSGIGWKFASQGLSLLGIALDESSALSQEPDTGNPAFARQLYLHAITYLLRALPSDLTTEEQLSVRSALPVGVIDPLRMETPQILYSRGRAESFDPPSLLHRALASTIVQLFIMFQFVLPYLKHLINAAYQYDRTYQISGKVFSQGIVTVSGLARAGAIVTGTVYGMNDGKMGQMMTETAAWVLESVTGGIHEGVTEGLELWRGDQQPGIEMR